MLLTTPAIVLRSMRYSESSRIVTLYTRDRGKMGVVARGASRPKSRLAPLLQPMSCLSTVIYVKEGRDLQNLASAETMIRFGRLSERLESISVGLAIVETLNAVTLEDDPHAGLFDIVVDALNTLGRPGVSEGRVNVWFLARLAPALGYGMQVSTCGVCAEAVSAAGESVHYSPGLGAPLCPAHAEPARSTVLSASSFRMLSELVEGPPIAWTMASMSDPGFMELHDLLTSFLRHHVDGMRRLRVRGVTTRVVDAP